MITFIKNTFAKKPKFEVGELVKTQYPKHLFPNLHTGMIVDIITAKDLNYEERLHMFLGKVPDTEKVYKVLLGDKTTRLYPEYKIRKITP